MNQRDQVIVEAAGILNVYCMDEVNWGTSQSVKEAFSSEMKDGRSALKAARTQLNSGDYDTAKTNVERAARCLKVGRKRANEIDDNGFIESALYGMALSMIPVVGIVAGAVHTYAGMFNLRKLSKEGRMQYSKKHPERKKNLVLEILFGTSRSAGFSRSLILSAYDKLIKECEYLSKQIDKAKAAKNSYSEDNKSEGDNE